MGCSSWIDQQPACEYDVYDWSDDLLAHVLTGDGSGAFDYDPADVPRKQLKGSYDPDDGDFDYETEYAGEYWIQSSETTGFGTVFHNGNLDLLFTTVARDILGVDLESTTRVQRNGCDMTIASWSGDDSSTALVMDGSYEDDSAWTWFAEVDGYDMRGGLRQNLSRSTTIEAPDGSYYSFFNETPEGTGEGDFEGWYDIDGDAWGEGTNARRFDGSTTNEITFYDEPGGSVVATYSDDFEYGGANGSWTWDDVTCTQVTQGDTCTISCDNGSEGSC
jgi:hypothetical protein